MQCVGVRVCVGVGEGPSRCLWVCSCPPVCKLLPLPRQLVSFQGTTVTCTQHAARPTQRCGVWAASPASLRQVPCIVQFSGCQPWLVWACGLLTLSLVCSTCFYPCHGISVLQTWGDAQTCLVPCCEQQYLVGGGGVCGNFHVPRSRMLYCACTTWRHVC
jgi:hypothetical protein